MKTKLLLGGCVSALAVVGFFVAQELRARNWEARWNDFLIRWQAEGEVFDPAKSTLPDLGEDSDFARHRWILQVAAGDAGVLQALEKMQPDQVDGYEEWESDSDDNGVQRPMPPELARRIVNHASAFRTELEAFADAARRPQCRLVADGRASTREMAWNTWAARLSPLGKLLGASAHAAAALGDTSSPTSPMETLLRAGNLLRSSNLSLGVVVGAGFESQAYSVVRSMPDPTAWPENERRRWLVALDLRTRPLADEFAATSRLERNFLLQQLDALAADRSAPLAGGLADMGPFRRIYLARARLAACEALQGIVLSDDGHLSKVIEPGRIARFQDHLETIRGAPRSSKHSRHSADAFGLLPQFAILGIQDGLNQLEADRTTARERVRGSLP
jgi:hypothetical protein